MIMEVMDYAKRTGDIKQDYTQRMDRMRQDHKDEVSHLENLQEKKLDKQQKTYLADKQKIENNISDNIKEIASKNRSDLDLRKQDYQNRLANQQGSFDSESQKVRGEFHERLNNLKDSFTRTSSDRAQQHEQEMRINADRYSKNLGAANGDFDTKLSDFNRNSSSEFSNLKEQNKLEQKKQSKDFDQRYQDAIGQGTLNRRELQNKYQDQLDEIRKGHEQEIGSLADHQNQRVGRIKTKNDDDLKATVGSFNIATEEIQDRNQIARHRADRENLLSQKGMKDSFQRDINDFKRTSENKIANKDAHFNQERLSRISDNEMSDARIKKLKKQMDDQRSNDEVNSDLASSDFKKTIKGMNVESTRALQKMEVNNHEQLTEQQEASRYNIENAQRQYQKSMAQKEDYSSAKIDSLKKVADARIEGQREFYTDTIEKLSEQNDSRNKKMRDEFAKEQTALIERSRRDMFTDREELKDDLIKTAARKEMGLEQRLEAQQKEAMRSQENFDKSITVVKESSNEQLRNQKIMEVDQRIEDRRASKRIMDGRAEEYEKRLIATRHDFDKKMDAIKSNNDRQLAKIAEEYESRMKIMQKEKDQSVKSIVTSKDYEYEKLKKLSDTQAETIRNQYELKIEKLRQANVETIERLARERRKEVET